MSLYMACEDTASPVPIPGLAPRRDKQRAGDQPARTATRKSNSRFRTQYTLLRMDYKATPFLLYSSLGTPKGVIRRWNHWSQRHNKHHVVRIMVVLIDGMRVTSVGPSLHWWWLGLAYGHKGSDSFEGYGWREIWTGMTKTLLLRSSKVTPHVFKWWAYTLQSVKSPW